MAPKEAVVGIESTIRRLDGVSDMQDWGFTQSYCNHCGIPNSEINGMLIQCAKCKRAYYCSKACFNNDLEVHNRYCQSGRLVSQPESFSDLSIEALMYATDNDDPADGTKTAYPPTPSEIKNFSASTASISCSELSMGDHGDDEMSISEKDEDYCPPAVVDPSAVVHDIMEDFDIPAGMQIAVEDAVQSLQSAVDHDTTQRNELDQEQHRRVRFGEEQVREFERKGLMLCVPISRKGRKRRDPDSGPRRPSRRSSHEFHDDPRQRASVGDLDLDDSEHDFAKSSPVRGQQRAGLAAESCPNLPSHDDDSVCSSDTEEWSFDDKDGVRRRVRFGKNEIREFENDNLMLCLPIRGAPPEADNDRPPKLRAPNRSRSADDDICRDGNLRKPNRSKDSDREAERRELMRSVSDLCASLLNDDKLGKLRRVRFGENEVFEFEKDRLMLCVAIRGSDPAEHRDAMLRRPDRRSSFEDHPDDALAGAQRIRRKVHFGENEIRFYEKDLPILCVPIRGERRRGKSRRGGRRGERGPRRPTRSREEEPADVDTLPPLPPKRAFDEGTATRDAQLRQPARRRSFEEDPPQQPSQGGSASEDDPEAKIHKAVTFGVDEVREYEKGGFLVCQAIRGEGQSQGGGPRLPSRSRDDEIADSSAAKLPTRSSDDPEAPSDEKVLLDDVCSILGLDPENDDMRRAVRLGKNQAREFKKDGFLLCMPLNGAPPARSHSASEAVNARRLQRQCLSGKAPSNSFHEDELPSSPVRAKNGLKRRTVTSPKKSKYEWEKPEWAKKGARMTLVAAGQCALDKRRISLPDRLCEDPSSPVSEGREFVVPSRPVYQPPKPSWAINPPLRSGDRKKLSGSRRISTGCLPYEHDSGNTNEQCASKQQLKTAKAKQDYTEKPAWALRPARRPKKIIRRGLSTSCLRQKPMIREDDDDSSTSSCCSLPGVLVQGSDICLDDEIKALKEVSAPVRKRIYKYQPEWVGVHEYLVQKNPSVMTKIESVEKRKPKVDSSSQPAWARPLLKPTEIGRIIRGGEDNALQRLRL